MTHRRVSRSNFIRLLFSIFKGLFALTACAYLAEAQVQPTGPARPVEPVDQTSTRRIPNSIDTLGSPASLVRQQNLPGAAKVSAAPAQLSLAEAIRLAIQNNVATLSADEQRRAARGFVQQARSALLPNISGIAYQASLTENLAALGFQAGTFPGLSRTFLGPFNNFDARA